MHLEKLCDFCYKKITPLICCQLYNEITWVHEVKAQNKKPLRIVVVKFLIWPTTMLINNRAAACRMLMMWPKLSSVRMAAEVNLTINSENVLQKIVFLNILLDSGHYSRRRRVHAKPPQSATGCATENIIISTANINSKSAH
jgi:hypothetical protein